MTLKPMQSKPSILFSNNICLVRYTVAVLKSHQMRYIGEELTLRDVKETILVASVPQHSASVPTDSRIEEEPDSLSMSNDME